MDAPTDIDSIVMTLSPLQAVALAWTVWAASSAAAMDSVPFEVAMEHRGSSTLYVRSSIKGAGEDLWLVDTGSGHSVINQQTLDRLLQSGNATFLKNLQGKMADGSTRVVPLYRISQITLGDGCTLRGIQAAVLPGNTRQILGISALRKVAPFSFSFDPPTLKLGHCDPKKRPTLGDGVAGPQGFDIQPRVESGVVTAEYP